MRGGCLQHPPPAADSGCHCIRDLQEAGPLGQGCRKVLMTAEEWAHPSYTGPGFAFCIYSFLSRETARVCRRPGETLLGSRAELWAHSMEAPAQAL